MDPRARLLSAITNRSRTVIAVVLVLTLVLSGGLGAIDDAASLDQFETESAEADELDYITDRFGDGENTTSVQVVVRDENVLSRDSLLESLRFQEDLRGNETVNGTLAEDPFGDLALTVARTAIIEEEADALEEEADDLEARADELEAEADDLEERGEELEERGDDLEERGEELEERGDELEERGEELEARGEELEADAEELEAREADLEERGEEIEADAAELETRQEQLESDAADLEERREALESDAADLEAEGEAIDERRAELEARQEQLEADAADLEAREEALEEDWADYERRAQEPDADEEALAAEEEELEERRAVLEADAAALQEREEALGEDWAEFESDAAELEERQADLEERSEELEADGEALEERQEELEADGAELEARQEQLESDAADLESDAVDLEARADELEEEREELEREADELEEEVDELEAEADELEEEVDELEAEADEIEEEADRLEEEADELEAEGEALEDEADALEDEADDLSDLDPSLEERIEQLESMTDQEVEDVVADLLDEDADDGLFVFLPTAFEPGSTEADARMLFVTQLSEEEVVEGEAPDRIVDSQLAVADLADDRFDDAVVLGSGIISDEIDRSLDDSLLIVLPLALVFVAVVLSVAYRDPFDILLGMFGVVVVLVWTFGFMGWIGIDFNMVMVAVPVLLIGLSIDYAIHVFMRHREQRASDGGSTRRAMAVALSGLGLALVWVTATAVIGFLSNLVSPVGPIREFGVVSAFGIASALVVFGVLLPATKLELDAMLERRGIDREKRAFGTGGGRFSTFLSGGQRIARRAPWVVVLVALLLTVGGAAGATQVDTTFEQEDFIADDPPEWASALPGPFAPGDYSAKSTLEYVDEYFVRGDSQAQLLVRGELTDDDTLTRIDAAEREAGNADVTVTLASGGADVDGPVSAMEDVADEDDAFNETFAGADTTGDGVPDSDVESVYDAFFEADSDRAADVLHRTDEGEVESARIVVSVRGDAPSGEVTEEMRAVAASLDGDGLVASATGQVIVFHVVEQELFSTVIESLLVTLVAVFAFLMAGYRWLHGSATLGAITLAPIVFSVAWILGSMYLLGISFNVMTGLITSLTVGLGVAYNIHMTERYMLERGRGADTWEALSRAVTGTGGALLGSAATTVGGFGVLVFAILPPLQQFGLITGLTIVYAFFGSVFVLPSFLALWTRYLAPEGVSVPTLSVGTREAAGDND
ncbi:efflux RND transporter permease subunit [Natronorarus salvus]|uniref:efflux RND transporter permease subunit n=1 Tax=Natronorarus salvus TaxID=3117733 RepID=UPI002F2676BD